MTKELTPEQQIQWDAAMAMPATRGELFAALSVINNAIVAITNHSLAISRGNREGLNATETDMLSAGVC